MNYLRLALLSVLATTAVACQTELGDHTFKCADDSDCLGSRVCRPVGASQVKGCVLPSQDMDASMDAGDTSDVAPDDATDTPNTDTSGSDTSTDDAGDTTVNPQCVPLRASGPAAQIQPPWSVYTHGNTANYQGFGSLGARDFAATADGTIFAVNKSSLSIRYDGNWTHFDRTNSPLVPQLFSVTTDGQGGVWVGGDGVIYHLKCTLEWEIFGEAEFGSPVRAVNAIQRLPNGTLWASAGENRGLLRYQDGQWKRYDASELGLGSVALSVHDLAASRDGKLAVASNIGLVMLPGQGTAMLYSAASNNASLAPTWAVSFDPDGVLWLGLASGFVGFDGQNWSSPNVNTSGYTRGPIYDIAFSADGTAYLATGDAEIVRFSQGNFLHIDRNQSADTIDFPISHIFLRGGELFAGADDVPKMVVRTDGQWGAVRPNANALYTDEVTALAPDSSGVFFGHRGGVSHFSQQNSTWKAFDSRNGLAMPANDTVTALHVGAGKIYVGTVHSGMHVNDLDAVIGQTQPPAWSHYGDNAGLPDGRVTAITSMGDGRVWIATFDSIANELHLSVLENGVIRSYGKNDAGIDGLRGNMITALAVTRASAKPKVVAGTDIGVAVGDIGDWRTYGASELGSNTSVPDPEVLDMYIGPSGDIYAATASGVFRSQYAASSNSYTWLVLAPDGLVATKFDAIAVDGDNSNDIDQFLWGHGFRQGGSEVVGYINYANDSWTAIQPDRAGLPSSQVRDIAIDAQHTAWLGHRASGASRYTPQ